MRTTIRVRKQEVGNQDKPLNLQERRFVDAYLRGMNARRAAIEAGYSVTVAQTAAFSWAGSPHAKPHVFKAIMVGMNRISAESDVSVERMRHELMSAIFADANELSEHRREACRYCYGKNFDYQYTPAEMKRDMVQHARDIAVALANGIKVSDEEKVFDKKGGLGFTPLKDPNPKCPECFGEGVGRIVLKDTTKTSAGARALYAGAKKTRDGYEIMVHSKAALLALAMKNKGMLTDRIEHDHSGTVKHEAKVVVVPNKATAEVVVTQLKDIN